MAWIHIVSTTKKVFTWFFVPMHDDVEYFRRLLKPFTWVAFLVYVTREEHLTSLDRVEEAGFECTDPDAWTGQNVRAESSAFYRGEWKTPEEFCLWCENH